MNYTQSFLNKTDSDGLSFISITQLESDSSNR